jgi:hypothetical protein
VGIWAVFENTQLASDLIEAAMHVCDQHGDSDQARADMRQQCMELPPALQADLLAHFKGERLFQSEHWEKNNDMSKPMTTARNPKAVNLNGKKGQTDGEVFARAALVPANSAAFVMDAYHGNTLGDGVDINALIEGLQQTTQQINSGDLSSLEAMLTSQATTLQTIFTSLARRAQTQETQRNLEAFLGLALKAQAQSRATISALVDLKYPRQATFVKQANIAHGPQQVNNAGTQTVGTQAGTHPHAKESQVLQNELLEDQRDGSTHLDNRTTPKAARGHSKVEAVEAIHRGEKRFGQGRGIA